MIQPCTISRRNRLELTVRTISPFTIPLVRNSEPEVSKVVHDLCHCQWVARVPSSVSSIQ